jgi:hypothetical protein
MKKIFYTTFIILLICTRVQSQSDDVLLFRPLTANTFEPRIGAFYNMDDENLRLDIGASFDLLHYKYDNSALAFGADFFTYTRIRSDNNFKFPVETSDYFFGINSSYEQALGDDNIEARFRLAHISSHLVDGYSQNSTFFKEPFVYSREFIDCYVAYETHFTTWISIRPYAGLTVVFSTIPDNINQFQAQIGIESEAKLNENIKYFVAFDVKDGENRVGYIAQTGFDFQFHKKFGVRLFYMHYNGNSMHGMFFKEKDIFNAVGFNVIYF